jgi:hypothetical protein
MRRHALTVLACCVTLGGCDPLYGVVHFADLAHPLPADCVREVLASTPGVEFSSHQGPPNVFSYWVTPEKGERVPGILQMPKPEGADYRYSNGNVRMGGFPPPQAQTRAFRLALRAIDTGLAERCGLTAPVKEFCYSVNCKPL